MSTIPEWVFVWKWARAKGAVRPFPQQADELYPEERETMLTDEEYDHLADLWRKAGSPKSTPSAAVMTKTIVRDISDILR